MKNRIFLSVLVLMSMLIPKNGFAQSKEVMRAKESGKVMMIINYVKDESKTEYEKFMNEIFFDLLSKSKNPLTKEKYQKTRWLTPSAQNENKTWTYAFVMDPLVENGDYGILPLFQERFSKEESEKLLEKYASFLAGPPDVHTLVQSKY